MKRKRHSSSVRKNASERPYKEYEAHPTWKRVDKAISDLVENQDLVERTARPYIVGYICKILSEK